MERSSGCSENSMWDAGGGGGGGGGRLGQADLEVTGGEGLP